MPCVVVIICISNKKHILEQILSSSFPGLPSLMPPIPPEKKEKETMPLDISPHWWK
ncbi:rCG55933 [Rattus norvegicus]|uniref:RCG55933 n=1 Tax=Rattus norvegicus TaxID=10116 RepID=A6JLW6_RAT|nr:rCG55933 [Rattus norvegicus]